MENQLKSKSIFRPNPRLKLRSLMVIRLEFLIFTQPGQTPFPSTFLFPSRPPPKKTEGANNCPHLPLDHLLLYCLHRLLLGHNLRPAAFQPGGDGFTQLLFDQGGYAVLGKDRLLADGLGGVAQGNPQLAIADQG